MISIKVLIKLKKKNLTCTFSTKIRMAIWTWPVRPVRRSAKKTQGGLG